jgi:type II secretory pathway component GspD/PulD (secretin)
VHITAGREFSYISDLTPVVAQGAVAFDPTVSKIQSGVQLQVTPQIMPSGDMASVDLHSTVTETSPGGPIPLESPTTRLSVSPPPGMAVERLNAITQQFHTTVRVPLRKKLLIGGMTLEPASKDNAPRQLYLVVEVDAVK